MIRANNIVYIVMVNGETFQFQREADIRSFLKEFEERGYQINDLSVAKCKMYSLTHKFK